MTKWSRGKTLRALSMAAPLLFGAVVLEAATPEKIGGASVKRAPSERAVSGLSPQEMLSQQQELHAWIETQLPVDTARATISVSINEQDRADLAASQADRTQSPMRVGVVKTLDQPITFTNGKKALRRDVEAARNGLLQKNANGDSVWVMNIESPGAVAIRVHFENVSIPRNSELYFFNDKGEAYGPYIGTGPRNTGDFWSNSVLGSKGTVMLRGTDLNRASLSITEIAHVATDFPRITQEEGLTGSVASFCSFNASCIENNSCTSDPAVNDAEGAVAKMRWISGAFVYICSGGLLADTDGSSQIPYFLTANHCMSKNRDAGNLEAYFQYTASCGTSVCAGSFDPAPSPSVMGASVAATGRAGDFTLLILDNNPPSGSTFLGWNNTDISGTDGEALHRVSHPSGAPQAYSEHSVDPTSVVCQGWPRGERIYSVDITGATEGGSSGSPVVNSAGECVGQLSGCCGYDCANECASPGTNWTVDGSLSYYWSSVSSFLDPQGGGGGCSTNGDCNDSDPCTTDVCNSGTCSNTPISCPSGQVCDNGVCVTPPSCGGNKASCSQNSDCCSNNCRNGTCKGG